LQRLFSTFANGWPGLGLLLQRIVTATLLVRLGIVGLSGMSFAASALPQLIGAIGGIFLFAGLWTPIAAALIAIVELWIAITQPSDPWIAIMLATFGGTLAMIGPGEWSIDARLYGRRHFED